MELALDRIRAGAVAPTGSRLYPPVYDRAPEKF
jgi:hypothetical protein